MERDSEQISSQLELSAVSWGSRWEAREDPMSTQLSLYYNYRGFHSIVLFALVDATYRFLYYEVGAQGRVGDGTIWNASNLKRDLELENGKMNTPQTNISIPSVTVADSAF